MRPEDIAKLAAALRAAGVTEFSGEVYIAGGPNDITRNGNLHLKLGPLPPAPPKQVEATMPAPAPREPLPPELSAFMTAELRADLAATLED